MAKRKQTFSVATQAEVADFFGVSVNTIGKWFRKGAPKEADGSYDLSAIAAWFRMERITQIASQAVGFRV